MSQGWHATGALSHSTCCVLIDPFHRRLVFAERINLCRPASTLSYEEFIETYALPGRPVVIKGGASLCFGEGRGWDREVLRKEAGDKVRPINLLMTMFHAWFAKAIMHLSHFPPTARPIFLVSVSSCRVHSKSIDREITHSGQAGRLSGRACS